jgi:dTDP-L-rhamnose 4-epimerase
MKILITGGAGFIGSRLAKQMKENGHQVRILDNLLPQVHGENPSLDLSAYEFIRGDLRDLEIVSKSVKDIEVVYHLAAETGVGQSQYEIERYIATNTLGTAVVLQAAVNSGVKQFIVTSSRAVYGEGVHICGNCGNNFVPTSRLGENLDLGNWEVMCVLCGSPTEAQLMSEENATVPTSIYGLTKLQQEQIAKQVRLAYPLSITILRLFNVFGPGQSLSNPYVGVLGTFFRRITAGGEIDIYEDGKMRRDFVYVDDVVETLIRVGGNEKAFDHTINVGNGDVITLEQAGREMFKILNVEPRMNFSGKYRLGDVHHAVADTTVIKETLNYRPPTSFTDGLRQYVAWALSENRGEEANIDSGAEDELKEKNLLRQAQR